MVREFGLRPGMTVVDFGAGSGAYTLAMAKLVPDGKVYAIDVQQNLLERLAQAAREQGRGNVEVIWGNVERSGGSKLRDGLADLVLIANVLFQVSGKYTLVLEAKRLLNPGGRLAIIDWQDSFGGLGPAPGAVLTAPAATAICREAGFREVKTFPAGDHHWGLIFEK